jgi:hypothetical protein
MSYSFERVIDVKVQIPSYKLQVKHTITSVMYFHLDLDIEKKT